jgi:hypothetical protein
LKRRAVGGHGSGPQAGQHRVWKRLLLVDSLALAASRARRARGYLLARDAARNAALVRVAKVADGPALLRAVRVAAGWAGLAMARTTGGSACVVLRIVDCSRSTSEPAAWPCVACSRPVAVDRSTEEKLPVR